MGLLKREDLGEGKETMWRLQLPFRVERSEGEPKPRILVGEQSTPSGGEWHLSNAVCEVLTTAADHYGAEYSFSFDGEAAVAAFVGAPPIDRDLEPLLSHSPEIHLLVELLAQFLDQTGRTPISSDSIELGASPDSDQTTLAGAMPA